MEGKNIFCVKVELTEEQEKANLLKKKMKRIK